MLASSHTQLTNDFIALEHAIHHDIVDIEDIDEFLSDDPEDCVHFLLSNAGCFIDSDLPT